jgi:hypothetical protein
MAVTHVEGPIGTEPSAPYGSATREGSEESRLLAEFDYVDARYVARISPGNPLSAGMRRFTEAEMHDVYGSRGGYERRVRAHLDGMVRDRFLLAEDVEVFR